MTAEEEKIRDNQALLKQKALKEAYKRLFATDDGKKVLEDLIRMYDTNPPIVPGDSGSTHYAVGQQSVVKWILNTIKSVDNLTQKDNQTHKENA